MNKFKKLHITLDNIYELNHFVYTNSLKIDVLGKEHEVLYFHSPEQDADKDPWLYQINRYGYRGENWSFNRQSIGFFGCSFTFGVGVNKSVGDYVQEKLSVDCINMGQPGASAITILKTFTNFIKFHPVDFAIITLPSFSRVYYPVYDSKLSSWNYGSLIPNWVAPDMNKIHKAAYKFFSEDTNAAYLYDYIQAAENAASISKTTILWSSWDHATSDFLKLIVDANKIIFVGNIGLDKARDQMHPGPRSVEQWSSNVVQKLKKYR